MDKITNKQAASSGVSAIDHGNYVRDILGHAQGSLPDEVFRFLKHTFLSQTTAASIIREAVKVYPEMNLLVGAKYATPERGDGVSQEDNKTFGEFVYGTKLSKADLIEFERNAVGTMNLKYVLMNEYNRFTECQSGPDKLTQASFDRMRKFTLDTLDFNVSGVDAMLRYMELMDTKLVYMPISDMGKTQTLEDILLEQFNKKFADHDHAIAYCLKHAPQYLPSFARLDTQYKEIITEATNCKVNIGQFIQGEMPSGTLDELKGMTQKAFDFYMSHFWYDVSGALGMKVQNGSVTCNESLAQKFFKAYELLNMVRLWKIDHKKAYADYIGRVCQEFGGFPMKQPKDMVMGRIIAMMRLSNKQEIALIMEEYNKLDTHTRAILELHFNKSWYQEDYAYLPYYGPATFTNLIGQFTNLLHGDRDLGLKSAAHFAFKLFARIFQKTEVYLSKTKKEWTIIVNMTDIANPQKAWPDGQLVPEKIIDKIQTHDLVIESFNDGFKVKFVDKTLFLQTLQTIHSLKDLQQKQVVLIAMGGGSDVVQATSLADQLRSQWVWVKAIVSVRTAKTGSEGKGALGSQRQYKNTTILAPGVHQISNDSSEANGRFYEPLASQEWFQSFLVEYDPAQPQQLQERLDSLGKQTGILIDKTGVIWLDTWGDMLYAFSKQVASNDHSKDQDTLVQERIQAQQNPSFTFVAAPGVDTPADANTIIDAKKMMMYRPDSSMKKRIVRFYDKHKFNGSDPTKYGKTSNAFYLKNTQPDLPVDFHAMTHIPLKNVLSSTNPWDPYVYIHDDTGNYLVILNKMLTK